MFHQGLYFHYGSHYQAFKWTTQCQKASKKIKQCYMYASILISPHWDIECHVHTNAFNLAIKVMLSQNLTKKYGQLIAYALRLLNNVEQNYTTTKREALAMVYAFHKFRNYLLGNKFIFYVNHMALLYLIQKPQILERITR
jgi:hypothetical protein